LTRSALTRLVIIAGVVTIIVAAGVIALEAVGRRERPTRSRAMRSDEGWTQVPQVCRPVTESPELILLVHDARGRYCMW